MTDLKIVEQLDRYREALLSNGEGLRVGPLMLSEALEQAAALIRELTGALKEIDSFAWSAMKADCEEARVECQRRIDVCRAALAKAQEG